MSSTARPGKRKREQDRLEKLRQYGVDLPDIRGLPVQVIPLHVHALKTATEFFRTAAAAISGPVRLSSPTFDAVVDMERGSQSAHGGDVASADVLGDIFGRIDQQAQQEPADQPHDIETETGALQVGRRVSSQSRDLSHSLKPAVEAWLDAIRRFHRDSVLRGQQGQQNSVPVSIPLAAFRHLWPTAMNQDGDISVAIQRAALHLCGQLLCKSSDCRQWLLDANCHLSAWVEHTARPPSSVSRVPSQTLSQWRFFQQESLSILEHLVHLGYQELYPTIAVAIQRLQQSTSLDSAASVPSLMTMWRRSRDTALQHYQREIPRVHRLMRRAHACMEVLVPRFSAGPSHQRPSLSAEEPEKDGGLGVSEDEEDSLLDWEDGCDEGGPPDSSSADPPDLPLDETGPGHDEAHEEAVERTLMAMQATAAVQNGAIEIHMGTTSPPEAFLGNADASIQRARQELEQCIQRLTSRHMPRLSAWVEGLTNADSLVQTISERDSSPYVSLISMPRALLDRRAEATRQLLDIKQAVAAVLASAKKLGVYLDEHEATANGARSTTSGRLETYWMSVSSARSPPRAASQRRRTMPRNTTHGRVRIKLGR